MKKNGMRQLLLLGAALIIFFQSIAQQQPKHEKKVYQSEDGTVYWNKSMPFFVRLSTSENGNESFLLKRDSTEAVNGSMRFDTEGRNWIRTRWEVDLETGESKYPLKEVLWPIEVDGMAPVTIGSYNSEGRYVNGGAVYYGKDAKLTLTSEDEVSGVDKIYYSDGSAFKEYKEPIVLDSEKDWNIKFYAVDNVGNVESAETQNKTSFAFAVDKSAPVTTLSVSGPNKDNILSPNARISISSEDGGSGVRKSFYIFDDGDENPYSGDLDLLNMENGEHTIKFYSVDNVMNKEEVSSFTFFLDKIAPEVNFSVEGDQHANNSNQLFVSARSKLVLTGSDNHAGLENIHVGIDGKENAVYSSPILADQAAGHHYLSFYGIDKVENKSREQRQAYFIDVNPPVIKYKMKGPNFERRDTLFVRDITKFTLSPYESGSCQSGVKESFYTDASDQSIKYEEPFSLKKDGLHKLTITALDNVNNSSNMTEVVFVDNEAPVIYHHFSVDEIGSKKVRKDEYIIYPKEVQVYLAATDKHAGTDKIFYSINGGPEKQYGTPINYLKSNTNFSIAVRAVDILGNEAKTTFKFSVEN